MADPKSAQSIRDSLNHRFGEAIEVDEDLAGLDELARIAGRRVQRRYTERPVDPALLRLLCACALSAPSKSDLQQADIVIATDEHKHAIADLIPDQPFIRTAPAFLVFLANGRRLAEIARMRGKPFPNDHLDQFFNAAVDAEFFADQPSVRSNFICAIGYGDPASIFGRSPRPEFDVFNRVL